MEFLIKIRPTSITINPGMEAAKFLQPLLGLFEYEDEFTETTNVLGYILDEETDTLFFHRGVDVNYVCRLISNGGGKIRTEVVDPTPCRNIEFEYDEIVPPRDEDQEDVIDFITSSRLHSMDADRSQLFLVKKTGFGKTYCAGVGLCKYGVKTLIIVHRENLINQWQNSLRNMIGMTDKDMHVIESAEEIYNITHNEHGFDYDVYIMMHATFRAGMKRVGSMKTMSNFTKNLGIGLKIIDEAHLEFRNTLLIDFTFNVKRNLYITATDGRSAKEENSIFKHVFSNAVYYKKPSISSDIPRKWVNYVIVDVNSHCKPNIYKWKVAGGRGMNPASYGKWVIQHDKKKTHFKVCRDLLRIIFERDEHAKVLLFMPLIELCEECAYFCRMELNYDDSFGYDLKIKTVNSHNSKSENDRNKSADVIVTTITSCGTGTDIHGITDIISCSPFVSKITAEQVFGRIRYCGKICHYYDIYDVSVPMDKFWIKSRSKKMTELALNTSYMSWNEDENK